MYIVVNKKANLLGLALHPTYLLLHIIVGSDYSSLSMNPLVVGRSKGKRVLS